MGRSGLRVANGRERLTDAFVAGAIDDTRPATVRRHHHALDAGAIVQLAFEGNDPLQDHWQLGVLAHDRNSVPEARDIELAINVDLMAVSVTVNQVGARPRRANRSSAPQNTS